MVLLRFAFTPLVLLVLSAASYQAQEPTPTSTILDITVPEGGNTRQVWVNLSSRPETGDVVRKAEWVDAAIDSLDVVNSRVRVRLSIPSAPQSLGAFPVEILGANGAVKGVQNVRLRWPKLATPQVLVLRQDQGGPASSELALPASTATSPVAYTVILKSASPVFLTSDRIRFEDPRIKADPEPSAGPVAANASASAEFRIVIDPNNLPDPGSAGFEIINSHREQRTLGQLRVASQAAPLVHSVEPAVVGPGPVNLTIRGAEFDANPIIMAEAVSASGQSRQLAWGVARESRGVLKATGLIDPGIRSVQIRVKNTNGNSSGPVIVTVNNAIRGLTVQELTDKGGVVYPEEDATLTLNLSDGGFPLPRLGDGHSYEVVVDDITIAPTIVGDGKLRVQLKFPEPKDIRASATEITRPIRVLRDKQLAWQADQGLVVQLPVTITDTATLQAPPLLPGVDGQILIRGKHFRDKDIEIVPSAGLEVKQGSKEVTASTLKFTVRTSGSAVPTAPVAFSILQDGRVTRAGSIAVTPLPDIQSIAAVRIRGAQVPVEGFSEVDADGVIDVAFDGNGLVSVGDRTYTVKAIQDTVGEPVLKTAFDVFVPAGAKVTRQILSVSPSGLEPGERLRVEIVDKLHPDRMLSARARVERTGWAHVGLLLGAAAARLETGIGGPSGRRDATLSDVHLGAEYIVSNYSNHFGIGAGVTLLGAPGAASTNARMGIAITPTVRFKSLTLMIGKQASAYPMPKNGEDSGGQSGTPDDGNGSESAVREVATEPRKANSRPIYVMLGLSFGTDLSAVLKAIGGGE